MNCYITREEEKKNNKEKVISLDLDNMVFLPDLPVISFSLVVLAATLYILVTTNVICLKDMPPPPPTHKWCNKPKVMRRGRGGLE